MTLKAKVTVLAEEAAIPIAEDPEPLGVLRLVHRPDLLC